MPDHDKEKGSSNKEGTTTSANNKGKSSADNSYSASKGGQSQNNQDSNKKAAKVAAKGAATYAAGPAGGAAVDLAAKTPIGDKILNKGGELLSKIPGMSKVTKKLDDSGALDAADKGISAAAGGAGGSKEADLSKEGVEPGNKMGESPSSLGGASGPLNSNKGPLNSLSPDNSSDEGSDALGEDDSGSLKSSIAGNIFLSNKKKLIIIGVCCIILLFPALGIFSAVGSADEDDAENGIGNPDREGAKGSKYESEISGGPTSLGGSCTYDIKGATNGQSAVRFNEQISNLKVRLMHSSFCDGSDNVPIEGESLIDFETYILGVVYGEISGGQNEAHAKTQAVAARSFILDRAIRGVNRANGVILKNENGQWVLQVRNCVADQVFCNPDQGCSKKGAASNQYQDVFSGVNNKVTYKGAMPSNAKARQWVSETAGQVLVNKDGYIVGTNYASSKQTEWRNLSNSLDYKQILLQSYGSNKDIYTANCTGGSTSTGDYTSWKQYGASYSSIRLGNSSATIQSAGCLVTSVAILIARSGVSTTVSGDFNPGTFVQKLNSNGGFDRKGNFNWGKVTTAAPNFVYQGNLNISNQSKSAKLSSIQSLLNSGYYVVAEVKGGGGNGQHWVAIDSVSSNTVHMFDPGSTATNLWQEYNWKNTSRLGYFKAN
ncbi:MAG: hypothetical protein HFJ12_01760 [Bacilli bacterium]|nr:hypothetical protein [Bacilli bacterium]